MQNIVYSCGLWNPYFSESHIAKNIIFENIRTETHSVFVLITLVSDGGDIRILSAVPAWGWTFPDRCKSVRFLPSGHNQQACPVLVFPFPVR